VNYSTWICPNVATLDGTLALLAFCEHVLADMVELSYPVSLTEDHILIGIIFFWFCCGTYAAVASCAVVEAHNVVSLDKGRVRSNGSCLSSIRVLQV
jgi:hypothetical protein